MEAKLHIQNIAQTKNSFMYWKKNPNVLLCIFTRDGFESAINSNNL